jgi:SOS-response transcriptional repressor LexA
MAKTNLPALRRHRLSAWIKNECEGSQAEFIRKAHEKTGAEINQGELSAILGGKKSFGEKKARALEEQAGMPDGYLDRDIGNVGEPIDMAGKVPLISWIRAGDWHAAADPFQPGDGEPVDSPLAIREGMYALTVRGDSMFNPSGQRSYPDGCRIFVDPNRRDPVNGDRVIAKIDGEDEVTFKVFAKDGARVFLKPLNSQYQPIYQRFRVLGTVVAKVELE